MNNIKNIIAIASGKGGVGKSTISVNLAISLANLGLKVGLLDADIYGPSIPHMLDISAKPEVTDDNKLIPHQKFGIKALSIGFLTNDSDDAFVWRGPMLSKALSQMLSGTAWKELDYLIIDMPPGTGDVPLSLAKTGMLTGTVFVATPGELALRDVKKSINMFKKLNVPILGIIQNMSYFIDKDSGAKTYIFGESGAENLAKDLNVSFLGDIPINIKIAKAGDKRKPFVTSQENGIFKEISKKLARM